MTVMCMNEIISKKLMVNESHPYLSLITSSLMSLILIFNNYQLFLNHACEHPIILKLCLGVPYSSQNYAGTLGSSLASIHLDIVGMRNHQA